MDSRILKNEANLLEKDDLTLTSDETLNPATFLAGKQEGGAPEHKCLDIIEYQTKVRLVPKPGSISLWMDPLR
jgi:hypothetical protein